MLGLPARGFFAYKAYKLEDPRILFPCVDAACNSRGMLCCWCVDLWSILGLPIGGCFHALPPRARLMQVARHSPLLLCSFKEHTGHYD